MDASLDGETNSFGGICHVTLTFLFINLLKIFFQEYHQCHSLDPDQGLIWVKTICKEDQLTTPVGNTKLSISYPVFQISFILRACADPEGGDCRVSGPPPGKSQVLQTFIGKSSWTPPPPHTLS